MAIGHPEGASGCEHQPQTGKAEGKPETGEEKEWAFLGLSCGRNPSF